MTLIKHCTSLCFSNDIPITLYVLTFLLCLLTLLAGQDVLPTKHRDNVRRRYLKMNIDRKAVKAPRFRDRRFKEESAGVRKV